MANPKILYFIVIAIFVLLLIIIVTGIFKKDEPEPSLLDRLEGEKKDLIEERKRLRKELRESDLLLEEEKELHFKRIQEITAELGDDDENETTDSNVPVRKKGNHPKQTTDEPKQPE